MPRGTIDWKSTESYTRLLAAMVAAQDMKLNYKKIADMYGEGATYDSIEGRFRIIKKEAAKLKDEIDSGSRPEAPARGGQGTPRKPRTPKSTDVDGVLTGRVSKSANSTPTKRRITKKDLLESSASSSTNDESSGLSPVESGRFQPDSFSTFDEYSFNMGMDPTADPLNLYNWEDEHAA